MVKQAFLFFASIFLTIAVVTPTVVDLFQMDEVIGYLNELEEDQNENIKELEREELYFSNFNIDGYSFIDNLNKIPDTYLVNHSIFHMEVISPPPQV